MIEVINTIRAAAAPLPAYANSTDNLGECVIYEFHTVQSDGITEHVRLEISIITACMDAGLNTESAIKSAILTLADERFNNSILRITLSGGGTLWDASRHMLHRIVYFEVIKRF